MLPLTLTTFLATTLHTTFFAVASKTVELDYGSFTAAKTDTYYAFKGVKYGEAPIGELRWAKTVSPPTKNLGKVDATNFGPACISGTSTAAREGQSEDCLFGNIYVPLETKSEENIPVMVWFHGGGYRQGSGTADPQSLFKASKKPFIFAAFNYRLAQFGFLGGTKINTSGRLNAGLEDQRAALRWVHKYIEKFGGDPTKVTIWGQSAGAGSVMFHLLAKNGEAEHLFRAAIADSPPITFTPKFDGAYIEGIYKDFAKVAGCTDGDTLSCLRKAKIEDLIAAGPKTQALYKDTIYLFAPVYGGFFASQAPIESFKDRKFYNVPLLTGSNTDDGFGWSARVTDPAGNTSTPGATEETVFTFIKGQYAHLDRDTFNQLVAAYPLSAYGDSVDKQAQAMYGEVRFICNAAQMSGSEHDKGIKAYHYRYNAKDATHGAELDALLATTPSGDASLDSMVLAMRQYWTSFVTDGIPSASEKGAVDWASNPVSDGLGNHRLLLTPGKLEFEDISKQLRRCNLWYSVGLKMGI